VSEIIMIEVIFFSSNTDHNICKPFTHKSAYSISIYCYAWIIKHVTPKYVKLPLHLKGYQMCSPFAWRINDKIIYFSIWNNELNTEKSMLFILLYISLWCHNPALSTQLYRYYWNYYKINGRNLYAYTTKHLSLLLNVIQQHWPCFKFSITKKFVNV
jgi:hypothetical protein